MKPQSQFRWLFCAAVAILASLGFAQANPSEGIGIDQNLGGQVRADLPFMDENGRQVAIGTYFKSKPIVLIPLFFNCQGVCDLERHALLQMAAKMHETYPLGGRYDVLLVSIHPKETPPLALATKNMLLGIYNDRKGVTDAERQEAEEGLHLLTGDLTSIMALTSELGFRFKYDPIRDTINHPAGAMVLTPDGRVSQYLFGVEYPTKLVQKDLDVAAQGQIGRKSEVILLGCIQVDPSTGKRTLMVKRVLNGACVLTVLTVGVWIYGMSRKPKGGSPTTATKGGQPSA